jgi:hypothetical protein
MSFPDDSTPDPDMQKVESLERWILALEEKGLEPVFESDVAHASHCLEQMVQEVVTPEEEETALLTLCDFCLVAWNLSTIKALDPQAYPQTLQEVSRAIDPAEDMLQLMDELVSLKLEMFPEQLYSLNPDTLSVQIEKGQIDSLQVSPDNQ